LELLKLQSRLINTEKYKSQLFSVLDGVFHQPFKQNRPYFC